VLGLEVSDPVLGKARQYILDALAGRVEINDPPEKNECWPLLLRSILAGKLAQIDPAHPVLDPFWQYWCEVARRAFVTGTYRQEDEAAAYPALSGIQVPRGFLDSQYVLWILTARSLPADLDQALVSWILRKPDGIRYLGICLQNPADRLIAFWFCSLDILARFQSWRTVATGMLNRLWEQRSEQGLWDYEGEIVITGEFPLSDTRRKAGSRQVDYSTRVLTSLCRYFY
jgi:hypothetical protein